MRRFIIALPLLLAAAPLAAASTPAAPARAPALRASHGTLSWNRLPRIRRYVVASAVGRRVTYRLVEGTRLTPASRPGRTVAYMVRANVRDARWSRAVRMTWPALRHGTMDGTALKVSVNNTTGWYVDPIFYSIGVRYERLGVGDGSDLTLVEEALSDGMTPLAVYDPGSGGSLQGVSPAEAAAQVVALAQNFNGLAARYPIMNKLRVIEFGNEVYSDETVAEYAAQYDAAHRALAAQGLSSWGLLAVATAACGYHAEDWIPDFISGMSGGAGEIDGWTVHPYGSISSDASPDCAGPHGFGWPDVRDWHQIAVNDGSNVPWYVTEVGQCISSGTGCPTVVTPQTQAADLTRYLNDTARKYPWVVFFNWYASCDDSSGGYGLLAENSTRACGADGASDRRPAFDALARWLAANGEG
jgi:hypothetical protein